MDESRGRDAYDYIAKKKFYKTSKCRHCKRTLKWGDGTYNFDHKNNNPADNTQRNCFLVCRNCHGKHTKIAKRKVKGMFGETIGHKTIKKKVGYKKTKKTTKKKTTKKKTIKKKGGGLYGGGLFDIGF